jgi:hypothetical protein
MPSYLPSSLPSDIPSALPSDAPSAGPISSQVELYSEDLGDVTLQEDDIRQFEESCTQFLSDYLPLVVPADYSDLACTVVSQSPANSYPPTRALQEETEIVFRTKLVVLVLKATSSALLPSGTVFHDVVQKTFDTFGGEFRDDLTTKSEFFRNDNADEKATPIIQDSARSVDADATDRMPWLIVGTSAAGGVCLALIVSFLLIKQRRDRRQPHFMNSYQSSNSTSKVASNTLSKSDSDLPFRGWNEEKATLPPCKSDRKDDFIFMAKLPPTPVPEPINIPKTVENTQVDITSEISPASYFGECGCLQQTATFDAVLGDPVVDGDLENALGGSNELVPRVGTVDSTELHGLKLVETSNLSMAETVETAQARGLSRLNCAKSKKNRSNGLPHHGLSESIDVGGVLSDCEAPYSSDEVIDVLDGLDCEYGNRDSVITPRQMNRRTMDF